ncbi:MAG: tRNA uracil 4-sulfurtransferase ThiI [Candidatus Jordarchaeales archaeon]
MSRVGERRLLQVAEEWSYDTVIVRFGCEVGVKSSRTRVHYEKEVCKQIEKLLEAEGIDHRIEYVFGRAYVASGDAVRAAKLATRIFGVSSVSPALKTSSKIDDIVHTALKVAQKTLKERITFAVRCRRTGNHPYTSMDICRKVGSEILQLFKENGLKVNLKNPDVTIKIEVRDDKAYVYTEEYSGPGGFPLGVQGKVICLLSGGIDSPVACWLMMKRGALIIPVYFDSSPTFSDEASRMKALDCAKVLFRWAGRKGEMYVIPYEEALTTIKRESPERYTCILCKRFMYRVAEKIAEIEKAEGIVTGEAVGEQASQTLRNLRVLNEAVKRYPVHRPLLGFDKVETEAIARKIGTYDISIKKSLGCTAAPRHPILKAKLEEVLEVEKRIEVEKMVEETLEKAKKVEI